MKNLIKIKKQTGFSLVEMLIVLSIITVLGTTAFMMLSSGLDIWKKATRMSIDHDLRIFVDKLKQDLGAISKYGGIRIRGTKTEMTFPCYIVSAYDPPWLGEQESDLRQINEVAYKYENSHDTLKRSYRKLYEHDFVTKTLLRDISSFSFSYFYRQDDKESLKEYDKLNEGIVPKFIKINVKYFVLDKKQKEFSEMIEVPLTSGVVL
jgi:prepilin-type N-terminal cleavage/methylation domain-containing protein